MQSKRHLPTRTLAIAPLAALAALALFASAAMANKVMIVTQGNFRPRTQRRFSISIRSSQRWMPPALVTTC